MLLLSARARPNESDTVTNREVEEVLTLIYTKVYPEGYSPDPAENRAYRDYRSDAQVTDHNHSTSRN